PIFPIPRPKLALTFPSSQEPLKKSFPISLLSLPSTIALPLGHGNTGYLNISFGFFLTIGALLLTNTHFTRRTISGQKHRNLLYLKNSFYEKTNGFIHGCGFIPLSFCTNRIRYPRRCYCILFKRGCCGIFKLCSRTYRWYRKDFRTYRCFCRRICDDTIG